MIFIFEGRDEAAPPAVEEHAFGVRDAVRTFDPGVRLRRDPRL